MSQRQARQTVQSRLRLDDLPLLVGGDPPDPTLENALEDSALNPPGIREHRTLGTISPLGCAVAKQCYGAWGVVDPLLRLNLGKAHGNGRDQCRHRVSPQSSGEPAFEGWEL